MRKYLNLFWLAPLVALLIPFVMILMMATVHGRLGSLASNIFEVMFFITPLVGVGVVLSLLVLLIIQRPLLKQINLVRTIVLATLDVIGPIVFLALGIVLSGFSR